MDSELKCNRLSCRRSLADKAVVTTCSHIFCIECANELFSAARLCPACDTTLTEPDDVVVCSLQPTNDYKTSVLSGLAPSIILEICSRAISFWQYQIHQETTFQQAVVRNLNDKNAQLQKQFDNVVREANGELNLLNNKKGELERDLELERRKVRELQDASRERDKEYAKLKAQFDKLKRKALLGPASGNEDTTPVPNQFFDDQRPKPRQAANISSVNSIVGGMENSGIQRTPLIARPQGRAFTGNPQHEWVQPHTRAGPGDIPRNISHRKPFGHFGHPADHSYASANVSDRSGSASEVEQMLAPLAARNTSNTRSGWQFTSAPQSSRPAQRVFAPPTNQRMSRGFRPAVLR